MTYQLDREVVLKALIDWHAKLNTIVQKAHELNEEFKVLYNEVYKLPEGTKNV